MNLNVPVKTAENHALEGGESETWRPESSLSFATTDLITYLGKSGKTYEEWLEEKQQIRRDKIHNRSESSITAPEDTEKYSKNRITYKKWLLSKSRERTSSTEVSHTYGIKNSYSGCSFEDWLIKKRDSRSKSTYSSISTSTTPREKLRRGMTFDQWKQWKSDQRKSFQQQQIEIDYKEYSTISSISGLSFQKWFAKKEEEKKNDEALLATMKAQKEQTLANEKNARLNDPRQRTFEEWFLEKKYENKRPKKNKDDKENRVERFPEDSNLLFDMWLVGKYMKEIEDEKEKSKNGNRRGIRNDKSDQYGSTRSLGSIKESDYSNDSSDELSD